MAKHKLPSAPEEIPFPSRNPEIVPGNDPEDPSLPKEPDIIPEEDPFENPPAEIPPPGEGP